MFLRDDSARADPGVRVVIQCAKRKHPQAGHLLDSEGRPVRIGPEHLATPMITWAAQQIEARQQDPRLFEARRLYRQPIYHEAGVRSGDPASVYVLSALWGIVRSDFRIPAYDATFSSLAPPEARILADAPMGRPFQHLAADDPRPILLFAVPAYLPLFFRLTATLPALRGVVLRNGEGGPLPRGVLAIPYQTTARTNWHLDPLKLFLGMRQRKP